MTFEEKGIYNNVMNTTIKKIKTNTKYKNKNITCRKEEKLERKIEKIKLKNRNTLKKDI